MIPTSFLEAMQAMKERASAVLGLSHSRRKAPTREGPTPSTGHWLQQIVERYLLPAWFALFTTWHVLDMLRDGWFGLDARIYHRAAVAWVAGADPWAAEVHISIGAFPFSGLPPTILAYAPFAWVPEWVFAVGSVLASFTAGAYAVRRLRLPWYWLLFPPLVMGALSGNPGVILLALLVAGHPVLAAIAAALKVYAVLPLLAERRWWALVVTAAIGMASAIIFSGLWSDWLDRRFEIIFRLLDATGGGTGARGMMIPVSLAAIAVIFWLQPAASGWLAIPALWPAAQFHYAVMAMPVATLPLAVLLAPPVGGIAAVAVVVHAMWLVTQRVARSRKGLGAAGHLPDRPAP